jgi:hypothetical protein
MSRNYSRAAADGARRKKRRNSILVSLIAVIAIVLLLVFEQVALLYVLATVGVAVLLIIVAFADLHGAAQTPAAAVQPSNPDDAAAIADAVTSTAPARAAASYPAGRTRSARRRQRR